MQPTSVKPKGSQDRPLLQVGDPVIVRLEFEEEFTVSVEKRIGNHVLLSNGIKFHILDDRWKSKEQWIDECTRSVISTIAEK